MFSIHVILL